MGPNYSKNSSPGKPKNLRKEREKEGRKAERKGRGREGERKEKMREEGKWRKEERKNNKGKIKRNKVFSLYSRGPLSSLFCAVCHRFFISCNFMLFLLFPCPPLLSSLPLSLLFQIYLCPCMYKVLFWTCYREKSTLGSNSGNNTDLKNLTIFRTEIDTCGTIQNIGLSIIGIKEERGLF